MSKFDSIRPYEDHEVEKVLLDLAKDKDVIKTILAVNKNKWLQNVPMIEKLVTFFLRRKHWNKFPPDKPMFSSLAEKDNI